MSILIVGYPYIRENYFKTFDHYPNKDEIFFLLPKAWKAKEGKVVFYPPDRQNIITAQTFFYHSNYFVIGGLLKGLMPSFPFKLWKIKTSKKITLVYSASEPTLLATLYQGFWAKAFGLKHIIFTWENIPYEDKFRGFNYFVKNMIIKLNILFSDGLVCGNQKSAGIHRRITNKPIAIVPLSGLDTDFFKPVQSEKVFRDYNFNDSLVFTFIGAISKRKGIHLIINAFAEIVSNFKNAKLVIAGSGEYEKNIKEQINKLDLGKSVILISWLDHNELVKLLSVSDIFLYPSLSYGGWEEQFGYSMAEASLMELPVISTHSGSIEELIIDNKTGILVKPNDVDELKMAMIRLAYNKNLRLSLGRNGRQYVIDKFSYSAIAAKFGNFFNDIIQNKHG